MSAPSPAVVVSVLTSAAEFETACAIRREVFIAEQQVPEEEEFDDEDGRATHVLARVDGHPAGTGRLLEFDGWARIGRMAVRRQDRGTGVGRAILLALISLAEERGFQRLMLHAQTQAIPFYAAVGFRVTSEEFDEAGIPHHEMERP